MSAIKTPVRKDGGWRDMYRVIDANDAPICGRCLEDEADLIVAALNACAGLTVEAMKKGVVERALNLLQKAEFPDDSRNPETLDESLSLYKEKRAIFALLPAAPNSEAGHD